MDHLYSFTIPVRVTAIIEKYIPLQSVLYPIYFLHCSKVTQLALKIANHHQFPVDREYLISGGMLHDIGIVETDAPDIGCFGDHPYIAHTYLGRAILESEGLFKIAPMCERHVGVGLTAAEIVANKLPLPHRDMLPQTIEERIICYADKFYSKSGRHIQFPKPIDKISNKISKYGKSNKKRWKALVNEFGYTYIYNSWG